MRSDASGDAPKAANATVEVLCDGYITDEGRVGSTVSLIRDGDAVVVVDPGMVASWGVILEPLERLGMRAGDVTDVVFSHHHPDHTLNAALFPAARYHDHWAIYQGDHWVDRDADGFQLSDSIRLLETPGHTPQDITTLAGTADGVVAFTHLWWSAAGPAEDPYATDPDALHAGRRRVLAIAGLGLIVPGHGAAFRPDATTPQ